MRVTKQTRFECVSLNPDGTIADVNKTFRDDIDSDPYQLAVAWWNQNTAPHGYRRGILRVEVVRTQHAPEVLQ